MTCVSSDVILILSQNAYRAPAIKPVFCHKEWNDMKYCPYCGASLPGSAASFCPNCGKPLRKRKPAQPHPAKKQTKRAPSQKPPRPQSDPPAQRADTPRKSADAGYDGYYNDVLPIDSGEQPDHMDPELVKQIILLVAGAAAIIVLVIILMSLL